MLVFNRGQFFSGVFTLVKLSGALVVLFLLTAKFVDMWQGENAGSDLKELIQEVRSAK